MDIISIHLGNLNILNEFLNNLGEAGKTFRYFEKRDIKVIGKHLVTLMLLDEDVPIGYGHLEQEGGDTWLGVCILPHFKGKGYGNLMMQELISRAKAEGITKISLTVDKTNLPAIMLYEKMRFKQIKVTELYYKYQLSLA